MFAFQQTKFVFSFDLIFFIGIYANEQHFFYVDGKEGLLMNKRLRQWIWKKRLTLNLSALMTLSHY